MIKANLEAELSALEKNLSLTDLLIWDTVSRISGLNEQLEILRGNKASIETRIDDLRDQMEVYDND